MVIKLIIKALKLNIIRFFFTLLHPFPYFFHHLNNLTINFNIFFLPQLSYFRHTPPHVLLFYYHHHLHVLQQTQYPCNHLSIFQTFNSAATQTTTTLKHVILKRFSSYMDQPWYVCISFSYAYTRTVPKLAGSTGRLKTKSLFLNYCKLILGQSVYHFCPPRLAHTTKNIIKSHYHRDI